MPFSPMDIVWYLVTIGVLITAHEYGHYRVAIACDIKVYRFSIGFGKVLWRCPFGPPGCEFALSAIPLGGYVAMLDEPGEDTPAEDRGRALVSRPLWQRAAVMLAGPAANLVLGVVFYAAAQFVGTQQVVPTLSVPPAGSMLAAAGQRSGDRIVAFGEAGDPDHEGDLAWHDVRSYDEMAEAIAIAVMDNRAIVLRARQPGASSTRELALPLDTLGKTELDEEAVKRIGLTMPYGPAVVSKLAPGDVAAAAGILAGDVVEAIDGTPVPDSQALLDRIRASAADGVAKPMQWQVRRGSGVVAVSVTARVVTEGGRHFGRVGANIGGVPPLELVSDGLVDSMAYGATQTWHRSVLSLRMFGRMLTGRASFRNLSGPISIGERAGYSAKRGVAYFLSFLATVSVGIGVLNLLPIPILDGGRLLYYLFEGVAGRPVSTPWQNWLRYGGVCAILLLMSLALFNDLARHLGQ